MQRLRKTQSARKHRVGTHRIVAAMRHAQTFELQEDGVVIYTGRDTSGRLLEVGAYENDDLSLTIFHALPKEWKR